MTNNFFLKVQQNFPEKFITYVHLAAVSGGSHLSEKVPATLFVDNIQMAINSLNACQISGISRVILVLSTACYSSDIDDPNESNLHMLCLCKAHV
jgi:nucleoside-diphosphate-sugar epimerase